MMYRPVCDRLGPDGTRERFSENKVVRGLTVRYRRV